jgi:hypothetical protein
MRKTFRIVQMLQKVSGWSWDDELGCCITEDNAASWDAFVEKHPNAKPFRNKGWRHLHKVSQIMPASVQGAHVYSARDGTMGIDEAPVPAHQEHAGSPTHWSESGFNDNSQVSCSKIKPKHLTNNTIGLCSTSSY